MSFYINLNWFLLFIIFSLYLINIWKHNSIKRINLEMIELKKEKEELIEKHKKQKEYYQDIIKNYSSLIQENKI